MTRLTLRHLSLLAFTLVVTGCTQPLLQDLPENEANELISELALAGVLGTKSTGRAGRFEVHVPAQYDVRAWRVAKAAGYPRPPAIEGPQRLVLGPSEAETLQRRRKGQQLSTLLRQRSEVVDARVVLDANSAAVHLRIRPTVLVDPNAIADIVRAGAGLRPTAQIQLDTTIVDHGRADETAAPPPKWPLRLATSAALSLAGMCLILLARMRRMRRLRQQDPPASEG